MIADPRLPGIPDPRPLTDEHLSHVAELCRLLADQWRDRSRLTEYAPDAYMAQCAEWIASLCSAVLEDRAATEIEAHLAAAKE